jgi:2-polyprenyl-3-methyl-5-hydroxy-6-metoxy-1,4-benzoquinol methylase
VNINSSKGSSHPSQSPACLGNYQAEVHSAEQWDEEYANGRWDYLGNLSELARFSIVLGNCAFFKPKSSILEVGCGPGILMRKLRAVGYSSYFGVDLSKEAIERTKGDQNENTRFEVANAETFEPSESYDVIVFNEMMYFLTDPKGAFMRFAKHLRPAGIVIVSMYRADRSLPMWRLLEGAAPVLDSVTIISNVMSLTWDIKVFGNMK